MRSRVLQAMDMVTDSRGFHLRLVFEGILVGVFAGGVVSAFRYLLEKADGLRQIVYLWLAHADYLGFVIYFGCLFCCALLVYGILWREPLTSGSGIPQIKGILLGRMQMNWLRVLILKFFGGVLAIGAGLSLGREGPSVQLGGAAGQGISRLERRSHSEERFLLTAGAGAGLAAAFNAPLAGVIFSLEELQKNFSPLVLLGSISAAAASTFVSRFVFGGQPVFRMGELPLLPLDAYGWLLCLGLIIGVLARGFNLSLLFSLSSYEKLPLPSWGKIMLPFALAGILGLCLPQILGGGNHLVDALVTVDYNLWFLLLLFAGKFLFTMISFGSGVPGGIFLPMLVLGALAGALCSQLAIFAGMPVAYVPDFIVFGMAAYFAAVVKSPVTGTVLIMEMTGSFAHLLPLICVTLTAYVTVDIMGGRPVYDELLARSLRKKQKLSRAVKSHRTVVETVVGTGSLLEDELVREAAWPPKALLLSVSRGGQEITPSAELRMLAGDYLYVVVAEEQIAELLQLAEGHD